jgi:hypothetical protein
MLLLNETISRWTWFALFDATIVLALAASMNRTLADDAGLSAAEIVVFRLYTEDDLAAGRGDGEVYARLPDKNARPDQSERNGVVPSAEQSVAPPGRSPSFLSDAQISIIKGRLNLMPHQERYWPAVESALRGIFLRRSRDGSTNLDPNSVQRLYAAARSLVSSLDAAQLREVQRLARAMGVSR